MSIQSLPEDLLLEIKRVEQQIKESHHRIKNEVNDALQLFGFDTSEAEKEVRALEVRLQELKQTQAKL